MSRLENAAKPLLLGLNRRERELADLTEEESGIVAALDRQNGYHRVEDRRCRVPCEWRVVD